MITGPLPKFVNTQMKALAVYYDAKTKTYFESAINGQSIKFGIKTLRWVHAKRFLDVKDFFDKDEHMSSKMPVGIYGQAMHFKLHEIEALKFEGLTTFHINGWKYKVTLTLNNPDLKNRMNALKVKELKSPWASHSFDNAIGDNTPKRILSTFPAYLTWYLADVFRMRKKESTWSKFKRGIKGFFRKKLVGSSSLDSYTLP